MIAPLRVVNLAPSNLGIFSRVLQFRFIPGRVFQCEAGPRSRFEAGHVQVEPAGIRSISGRAFEDGRRFWFRSVPQASSPSLINEGKRMPAKRELTMRQIRQMLRLPSDGFTPPGNGARVSGWRVARFQQSQAGPSGRARVEPHRNTVLNNVCSPMQHQARVPPASRARLGLGSRTEAAQRHGAVGRVSRG